jgi:hypothetical protein
VHALYNALVLLGRLLDKLLSGDPVGYTLADFQAQGWSSVVFLLISLPLVVTYLWRNWPTPGLQSPYQIEYIRSRENAISVEEA